MNEFPLETGKETLGRRIVPTVASPAHAAHDFGVLKCRLVIGAGILAAAVTVTQQSLWRFSVGLCHRESRQNQRALECFVHRPADDASREQVDNDRKVLGLVTL